MKNLTKIFAVVVALFAFSCATDPTDDLGVDVGGQTTIALSLEDTRTQLGEKADGVYPLYWSEGDQISVNGVASAALTASQAGKSSAVFTVNGVHTTYNIAYPAAAEGEVIFAASQVHAGNTTFGNNATTLYGVGSAEEGVVLNHLTGVLKIGVTGEATLSHAQVSTIDRAPIAGAFDIDFTSGEVTPTATSVATINYSFGEGVTLSAEPTFLHIAVPEGVYNELYVTLYDKAGGVMYATVHASESKPLVAGNVREFKNHIAYQATETLHIIKDVESLKALATVTSDAVLVADIDLSGEAWTPIEGYAGVLNGNGYAIKGLTAPLFGNVAASISGLHLTDVNINETTIPNVGAFARHIEIPAESENAFFENCSASGKVVVNCVDCSPATEVVWGVGGLVGVMKGAQISNCVSNVEVDVKSVNIAGAKGTRAGYVAGVIGYTNGLASNLVNNASVSVGTFETAGDLEVGGVCGMAQYGQKLTNNGKITISGTYTGRVFVAGVMAYSTAIEEFKSTSCTNKGAIEITKDAVFNGETYIGGMAGCTKFSVANCTNSGDITINGTFNTKTVVAGNTAWAFASLKTNEITGADNSGDITFGPNVVFASLGLYPSTYDIILNAELTGEANKGITWISRTNPFIAGSVGNSNTAVRDTDVSGNIIVNSGAKLDGGILVGGVVAYTTKWVEDCEHNGKIEFEEGVNVTNNGFYGGCVGCITDQGIKNVTNRGEINFYGTNSTRLFVGGVVAQSGIEANTVGSEPLSNLKNYSTINLKASMTTSSASTNVGGVACYVKGAAAELYNYGAVTVAHNESQSNVIVAGIIADADGNLGKAENHAAVTVDGPTGNGLFVGGLVGTHANVSQRVNQKNTGAVTVKNTASVGFSVGGLYGSVVRLTCRNCHNEGAVSVSNVVSTGVGSCAGVGARLYDATNTITLSNVTNSGEVNVDATATENFQIHVAGIIGWHSHKNSNIPLLVEADENGVGVANSGNITAKGPKATADFTVAGIVGFSTNAFHTSEKKWTGSVVNSGNITAIKHEGSDQRMMVGGLFGVHNKSQLGETATLVNTGNITVSGPVKSTDHIGGLVGKTSYAIHNGKCVCEINAIGFPNVGMVTGAGYKAGTIEANNCQVGGVIYFSEGEYGAEDDPQWGPIPTALNANTFHKYLFGNRDTDAAVVAASGCSYISKIE